MQQLHDASSQRLALVANNNGAYRGALERYSAPYEMPQVRHFVVCQCGSIRAAAQPECSVRQYNTSNCQKTGRLHGIVTARNSVKKVSLFTQLHADEQLHNVSITGLRICCKSSAETVQQTRDGARGHKQGQRLTVAFAVVQVAPAVPHALFDKFHLLGSRPIRSKSFLGDVVHVHGFAQALQGSSEEEAGHGIDGHSHATARCETEMHVFNARGNDGRCMVTRCRFTAQILNCADKRRHGANDLSDGQAVPMREPVATDEHVGNEMFQPEMRVVGLGSAKAQLWQHHLYENAVKRLKDNKSAVHEQGHKVETSSGYTHISQRPPAFTKGLMEGPRKVLRRAIQLGSLAPPETTAAHPYSAWNMAATRSDSTGCSKRMVNV